MCGIFGVIDYSNQGYNLLSLVEELGKSSVIRGSHATGITVLKDHNLLVKKEPIPSTQFNFKELYPYSKIYMGHVRLATQGKPELNFNNHPFINIDRTFSLAHNGILYFIDEIKEKLDISSNKIETDTYLAVQLLDKYPKVTLKSIKFMCENVVGEFLFTILDKKGNMFFAKKDNPICIYDFYKLGLIVYASTEAILSKSVDIFVQLNEAITKGEFKRIKIKDGEIVKIKNRNNCLEIDRKRFDIYKSEEMLDNIEYEVYKVSPCDTCIDLNCSDCKEFDGTNFKSYNSFDNEPLYKYGNWF